MRKFTLLIASLFITIGAMAQTAVLHYENITSRQELSSDDANTIRNLGAMTVIADVEITNSSTPSIVLGAAADYTSAATTNGNIWALGIGNNQMRYIVNAASGGWYSRGAVSTSTAKLAYTYNYANNQTTINYYTEGGTSQESVTVTDAALSTFNGENAKFYIGGVEHTNSNGWYSAFAGTINSIDIYQGVLSQDEIAALCQVELPEGFIATPEEFVNNKVYTFTTARGKMGATAESSNVISTAKTTVADTETDYFKWAVYKSENENYYLYNIGKAMFMGVQSTNNTSVPFAATPQGKDLTFKTSSSSTYPIMFSTDNAGVVNHSTSYGEGLITWTGGWSDLTDDGSNHMVVEAGDIDPTVLAAIESAVALYEADNTAAVAELDEAINKAIAMSAFIGEGVGKYSYTGDGDYQEKFAAIVAFREGITATNTPTPEEVAVKTAELNALLSSFVLNMPENGEYFRVAYDYGGTIGKLYLQGIDSEEIKNNQVSPPAKFSSETGAESIWYYYDGVLYSYTAGKCLREDGDNRGLQSIGTKTTATFSASTRVEGKYNIACASYIHANSNGENYFTDHCGTNNCAAHDLILEAVTELPVTVTEAGYATLYAPVALEVADDVKAYTVAINEGGWADLNEITNGVIPAETGVIIAGANGEAATDGTYNFAITTSEETLESDLRGSAPATYYTEAGTYYALAQVDGVVGFYKDQFNNSRFQNNSHKAYLYVAEGSANVASYSFRFGEGTTGIDEVKGENGNVKTIYDLTGRRVEAITAPGIYVVNGKKVLVK